MFEPNFILIVLSLGYQNILWQLLATNSRNYDAYAILGYCKDIQVSTNF